MNFAVLALRFLLWGWLADGLAHAAANSGTITPGSFDRPSAGDNPGEAQPAPTGFPIPPAPVLSPEEALKTFRMPAGYRMEVVASEPLISTPVAIDFDFDGRIWVVEMRGYQTEPEGTNRLAANGRISVLEDTDGDGRMDRSTVYMDGLVMPRSVKVLLDGVLVAEPPHVWFTRDTDGDGRADEKTSIANDYGLQGGNPANTPSGLYWGMDNWLQSTTYTGFFRRIDGKWIRKPMPSLGKWGWGMDDYGRTYMNGSSGPIRANLVATDYQLRNPNINSVGGIYENITAPGELELWPARPTPGVNRGYQKGQLRKDGTLVHYTAACGLTLFRGDRLPAELRGNHFLAEPAANLVRRSVITETANGTLNAANPHHKSEFLASTDERFRPVNLNTAPDGTLYVVDMYRGLLEAHPFVTTYLKRQVHERGLLAPLDGGRIYRVVHESMKPGPAPRMSRLNTRELVATLAHRNGWWRDTAQRLLVERRDKAAAGPLRELARTAEWEVTRLHAFWTLEGLDSLSPTDVQNALRDSHPKVRGAGVRLAESWLRERKERSLEAAVLDRVSDPDPHVRLQAALSLGELGGLEAETALAQLVLNHASQPYLIGAAVSSLPGREVEFIERIGEERRFVESPDNEKVLKEFGAAAFAEGNAQRVTRLLQWAAQDRPHWQQRAILGSVSKSARLSGQAVPARLIVSPDKGVAELANQLSKRIEAAGNARRRGQSAAVEPGVLRLGERTYAMNCAPCHQADGRGLPDTALPLIGSKWVIGPEELAVRIVLLGKQGKVALMPPWGNVLQDGQIAAVLTYIRRQWGNQAPPVSADTVRKARSETRTHQGFWTDESLAAEAKKPGLSP